MARFYADEDFSYPAVEELRRLGHDVWTAQEAGQANAGMTDEEILAFATSLQRAALTFNRRHFIRLHLLVPSHFGIVACSRDPNVASLAGRIAESIAGHATLENQLIRINHPRTF